MKSREFVNEVLKTIRLQLPRLYDQHIKGRREAFITENASQEQVADGIKIGNLSRELRVLCAIVRVLQGAGLSAVGRQRDIKSPDYLMVAGLAQWSMGTLCELAFWEFVRARFSLQATDKMIIICNDWSVIAVGAGSTPYEARKGKSSILGKVAALFAAQADISDKMTNLSKLNG